MPTIRLMTYNLRVDIASSEEPPWAERREAVATIIRTREPDVVGVQEALPRMLDDLHSRLEAFKWVGMGRGAEPDEHCALFYRPDAVERIRHDTFWLSRTPSVPGSTSWDAAFPRIVTWAEFDVGEPAQSFYVFNTHFDHESEDARVQSARLLRKKVDAIAGSSAAAVTGDLNATPDAAPYSVLTHREASEPLRDALLESSWPHHGPVATFRDFDNTARPHARIDYILVRGPVEVRRHETLTDRPGGYFASDHCPVLAELALSDAENP